jgi:hypothetical protein
MKIFFTASPRALRLERYTQYLNNIYTYLSKCGEHTSNLAIKNDPDEFYNYSPEEIDQHYKDTIYNLKRADIIVVEVTMHSMAMGYLVNKGLELNKPTLCLYTDKKPPFFLSGVNDQNLLVLEYSEESLDNVIDDAIDYFSGRHDKRFNLMIGPEMLNYLNEKSKKVKKPKSVYIRDLIRKDMKN